MAIHDATILPKPPFWLSVLNKDDQERQIRLQGATVKDALKTARELSKQQRLAIIVFDSENLRLGAYVDGDDVDPNMDDLALVDIVSEWQNSMRNAS